MTSSRLGEFPAEKQLEVLVAVATCWSTLKVSPPLGCLAQFLGKRSTESVRHLINKLIARGLLERFGHTLYLTERGHTLVYGEQAVAA